jgi:hypothetical protein
MGMSDIFPREPMRALLASALPADTRRYGGAPPQLGQLYVPLAHVKALHPDSLLVTGIRGAGKTLWWEALLDGRHRALIEAIAPRSGIKAAAPCDAGFGEAPQPDAYPDPDTLADLLTQGIEPRQIWHAVIARHVLTRQEAEPFQALQRWSERVAWLTADSERTARAFYDADRRLAAQQQTHLVLFDALDRTASEWPRLRPLLRSLLQVLLEFRPYRAIRPKVFVRPDLLDDPEVRSFPDASKLLDNAVALTWPRRELYGVLWQYLGNATDADGAAFREGCARVGAVWEQRPDGTWLMPAPLRQDEDLQRQLFHSIAGPWMGTDARRGFPYTWLPNHLGDANQQTSPRSLLAAVREAAEASAEYHRKHPNHPYALHYEALKRGVQRASRIRVEEIREDYPWVAHLMQALKGLKGLVVPARFQDVEMRWQQGRTLEALTDIPGGRLPPRRLDQGAAGVRDDLADLGVFQPMPDGRINIPDVYRVGFGLGRRGGVRPVGTQETS